MGQTVSLDYLALYEYTLPKPQLNAEAGVSKLKDHLDTAMRDLKTIKILRIWPQNIEMDFNNIKCEQFKEHQHEDAWYYGEMNNNQKQGTGILVYGAGSSITNILGNFNKDKLEGQGLVLYSDETYYFGGWKGGKCEGFGYYKAKNGDFYLGDWREGELTQGYYRNSNYEYYGQMKNGNLNGYGRCIYYDGAIVEGQWENDQMHGFITHQFPNGDVYHGDCKYSLKHGMGILDLQKENEIYAGNFCMDKYHGFGQLIKIMNENKTRVIKNGFFQYGQLVEMYQEFSNQDQEHLNWKLVEKDRLLQLSNKGTFQSELNQQELNFKKIIEKRSETSQKIENIIMSFNSHKEKYIKFESQLNMVTELVKLQKWYYAVDSKNLPSHFQNEWTNYLDAESS